MDNKMGFIRKNHTTDCICAFCALLNLITLAFTVIEGGSDFLSGGEFFYANGFTLAFRGYPVIVEGCGAWLRLYCAFHFCSSAILMLLLVAVAMLKRSFDLGKVGTFTVVSSLVLSLLYLVHGIIAYSVASDYAGLYYECSTLSFMPFIIISLMSVLYFGIKFKMKNEIATSNDN